MVKVKKTNKFNSRKIEIDGFTFDSILEGTFYVYLKNLRDQGLIKDIERQIPFQLDENDPKIGMYYCDFSYFDIEKNKKIFIEIKTVITYSEDVFKLKMKLLGKQGININIYISSFKRTSINGKSFQNSQFVYKSSSMDIYHNKNKHVYFNEDYFKWTLSREYRALKESSKTK